MALVTGGARRLGAAISRALHAAGFNVAVHHLTSSAAAEALTAELNDARADTALALAADLTADGAPEAVIDTLARASARLDLLVNNASVFEPGGREPASRAGWDRMIAVNARAPLFLQLAAQPLLAQQQGAIVNILDVHARIPRAGYTAYCASKAALAAITRNLALEFAPAVRVNGIAPGAILWAAGEDDAVQAETLARVPLGRSGHPQDVADAVVYLARASYVTGQVIDVDGGRSLGA